MKTLILCSTIALLTSCGDHDRHSSSPPVTEIKKGSVAKAEMLQAEIKMAAGELHVQGVDTDEVSAEFRYSSGGVVPTFRVDNTTFRARAVIEQSKKDIEGFNLGENTWRVQLPTRLATDLEINIGAGEANLNLGKIDLRKVDLHMGAGKVVADFSGDPKRDYEVNIKGGVGECEVILPKSAGIRAEAHGGIGSIDVTGLEKHGSIWESANLSSAKTKIRLNVHGGIGSISVMVR
jgi:hypothetical protein